MRRAEIVAAARSWIGTPYRHQASLRGVGCDCLGLLRGVWREVVGDEPEAAPAYSRDWAEASGREALLACDGVTKITQVRPQTAAAWKLEEPIDKVPVRRKPRYGIVLSTKPIPGGTAFAFSGDWRATRLPCVAIQRR